MDQLKEQGSKAYLISIVMVAVLGGLLFGYDTAVISGAEKGLQAFFKTAQDFDYTDGWHGFTSVHFRKCLDWLYHRIGHFRIPGH